MGTMSLGLTFAIDNIWLVMLVVDASSALHVDCKGHTGVMMTFGKGAVTSFSWKPKINTKSSTDAELVGVDDALPQMSWALYFIDMQGYMVRKNKLREDNQSAIKLEETVNFQLQTYETHTCSLFLY